MSLGHVCEIWIMDGTVPHCGEHRQHDEGQKEVLIAQGQLLVQSLGLTVSHVVEVFL